MRILFFTQRLAVGGAERQLVSQARGLAARGHVVSIATLYPGGELSTGLSEAGVLHVNVGKSGRYHLVSPLLRLSGYISQEKPDIVSSWLTVPNIVAGLLNAVGGRWPLVFNVRHAFQDLSGFDWLTRVTDAIEPRFARFAHRILVNSEAGKRRAIAAGFPAARLEVLPNGIDLDRFRPDRAAGKALRRAWGIPDEAILIGYPARIDRLKGHDVFLDAAAKLAAADQRLHFVCAGVGDRELSERLRARAQAIGLGRRLLWPGLVLDMTAFYNSLDLAVMCSLAEAWPNVVGEALACGVPVVGTEVGDAALILQEPALIVPPNDPRALADAITARLAANQTPPVAALRRHIAEHFDRLRMLDRIERLLTTIAAAGGR